MSDQNTEQHIDPETGEVLTAEGRLMISAVQPAELSVVSAEINQQIATARRFPRRKDKVIALEILSRATLNDEIAGECFYKLKRGDKDILGPSIRFAEIVRASWGNIRVASRFTGIDERVRGRAMVVVEAVAMDMQTNDAVLMSVSRSIMTSPKNGSPRMFTPDMVNTTMMAAQSIAQRDATLRLIPKAIWVDGYHAALDVIRGTLDTLGERREKAIKAFSEYGIKPEALFKALGIDSEQEIGLNMMPALAGMWTSLKEGESIEAVLGRATEQSGAGERTNGDPARNPLDDRPKASGGETADERAARAHQEAKRENDAQTVAEKQQEKPSNEPAKSDKAPGPRAEPAGEFQDPKATQQRTAAQDAPAAAAREPERSYLEIANLQIDAATSASKLRNWWKTTRAAREAAQLSSAALAALQERYEAKLDALEGRN